MLALYFFAGPRRYLSIWLLFFLATAGFQMIPVNWIVLPKAGVSKAYDWVLVFTAIAFFFQPKYFLQSPVWKYFRPYVIFGLLLLVLFVYSIFFRDIEFSVTVRVFRNFIIFIVLFLFVLLELSELRKIFRGIVYATSLASLIYCLQPLLHTGILNMVSSDLSDTSGEGVTRFYNVPVFVYPVVFFLFYSKNVFSLQFNRLLLCINLLAILLSQHRNLILAVGICFFLLIYLQGRMKLQYSLHYLMLDIGIVLGADTLKNKRFSKGVENLSTLPLNTEDIRFSQVSLSELSTTRFRHLILAERFQYIMASETRAALGIGLMTDDSKKATPLKFYIGIPDDDGNISQIANIDIAWAALLLQLGLPGTLLFCWLHIFLVYKFWRWRGDRCLQIGILYLAGLLITSFYGSMISMPYTTCLVMLFAAYYYQLTQEPTAKKSI